MLIIRLLTIVIDLLYSSTYTALPSHSVLASPINKQFKCLILNLRVNWFQSVVDFSLNYELRHIFITITMACGNFLSFFLFYLRVLMNIYNEENSFCMVIAEKSKIGMDFKQNQTYQLKIMDKYINKFFSKSAKRIC